MGNEIKVSDYIVQEVLKAGIRQAFVVVGGGAMHLDDSFGHSGRIHCTFQHNEQACAMAAEAYARVNNRPACVLVTTGPGATNALTGCLCAWMESIPVLIISGQARYVTTVRGMGLKVFSSRANFLFFRCGLPLDRMLLREGIAIRCCGDYHGLSEQYFRIAVRTREENRILLNAIERCVKNG